VVVLELCESRYKALVAERELQRERGPRQAGALERMSGMASTLQEFQRNYGFLQTALVALLSSSAEVGARWRAWWCGVHGGGRGG
jgi:hypothetical protein